MHGLNWIETHVVIKRNSRIKRTYLIKMLMEI